MRCFTYILLSLKNRDIYIGSAEDIKKRFILHNAGKVRATKAYRPWKLLEYYEYNSRGEAMKQEKFFKTGQQREIIKRKHGLVAKR